MIYLTPTPDAPIDQGDLIDECPISLVTSHVMGEPSNNAKVQLDLRRIIVLTQTCDLANHKSNEVVGAVVFDAQELADQKILKPADIKGPLRSGRIWGMYFLPAMPDLGLNEMIVDLRRLHTIRFDILSTLCKAGKRKARLEVPYREHLAKHFGDTFCRIGLPQPYETL